MTELTRPRPFLRQETPSIPGGEWRYVLEELRRLEATLRDLVDLSPQEANAEPPKLRNGLIRLARDPWRPVAGQTDDQWVFYDEATAAWYYLHSPL